MDRMTGCARTLRIQCLKLLFVQEQRTYYQGMNKLYRNNDFIIMDRIVVDTETQIIHSGGCNYLHKETRESICGGQVTQNPL
uniref:Uncharacterized protein n=1 Tax=Arion vulgaris TaxID=1028688 RepID=A0A0B7BMT7_9EUPU